MLFYKYFNMNFIVPKKVIELVYVVVGFECNAKINMSSAKV